MRGRAFLLGLLDVAERAKLFSKLSIVAWALVEGAEALAGDLSDAVQLWSIGGGGALLRVCVQVVLIGLSVLIYDPLCGASTE